MEERQLRTIVCPDHNLRYDPTVADGCVRCMRLSATASGRTPNPYAPPPAAAAPPKNESRAVIVVTVLLAVLAIAGKVMTKSWPVDPPEGAYVDKERGFAIVVPDRWKVVDPSKVSYLSALPQRESTAATLISDLGRLAPMVRVDVMNESPGAVQESKLEEFEKGFRSGFSNARSLDLRTEIATVDRIKAIRSSVLAVLPQGQQLSMDQYFVPNRKRAYIITAVVAGEKREETAEAAKAIASGFRVLERRPIDSTAGTVVAIACIAGVVLLIVLKLVNR